MKRVAWDNFKSDNEALEYLRGLPRYRNTALKSAFWRAVFFLNTLYCRLLGLTKPLLIVLVTNNSCNMNCTYCYGKYGERKGYEDYSTKELLKIIDELKELGTVFLIIHGGESLLRKDIGEILNYTKQKGFYVSFNTNGTLVPKKIDELRCVDAMCVSLDGRKDNNDKNRGNGCYDKVIKAIDTFRANNIPLVIHATLTTDTMGDMEFLAELAVEKKVKVQYSILYNPDILKNERSDIIMDDQGIRNTVRKIRDLKNKGYPVFYTDNVLTTAINWPVSYEKRYFTTKDEEFTKNKRLIPCYHGVLKYQVDADGRVVTCWSQDHPDAPNIKEYGVAGAIKKCHDNDDCRHCAFLANNEQNALMDLSLRNILSILLIHLADVFKIAKQNLNSTGK